MNFKFKLSRRLAGLKSSVVVLGLALGACSMNDKVTGPTSSGLTASDTSHTTTTDTTKVDTTHAVAHHNGYFVAPDGSTAGDGSEAHPWDLASALNGAGGKVQPGDTVWLKGGTYTGTFRSEVSGAVDRPVVFRQYPGERATIDGELRTDGADVAFWGFEIMRSHPDGRLAELESRGPRQKFINLVIHDGGQQGVAFWDEAVNSVMYGCIIYNNGTHENLDHGAYVHNLSGSKLMKDNIFFNNLAWGIHIYSGPGEGVQRNISVIGNVSFDNGTISTIQPAKGNIIVGNEEGLVGMQVRDNLLYYAGADGNNMRVGYTAANQDVQVTGNMVYGGATTFTMGQWSSAVVQNNTFGGPGAMVDLRASTSGFSWSGNKYWHDAAAPAWMPVSGNLSSASSPEALAPWQSSTKLGGDRVAGTTPTATQVFVKPNDYEGGRSTVVVYNFGHGGSVNADLSHTGLGMGQRFEVRNVQDLFGAPVATGTYDGGAITLPMTGVTPPAPHNTNTRQAPKTGPNFDVFEVIPIS